MPFWVAIKTFERNLEQLKSHQAYALSPPRMGGRLASIQTWLLPHINGSLGEELEV